MSQGRTPATHCLLELDKETFGFGLSSCDLIRPSAGLLGPGAAESLQRSLDEAMNKACDVTQHGGMECRISAVESQASD